MNPLIQSPSMVLSAYKRVRPYLHETPILQSETLNKILGSEIYFKIDSLQKTGSFKVRGSLNHLLELKENNLYLNSIIIHHGNEIGGHYTCLYECKGIWNEFDDIRGKSKIIDGGFDAIIKNDRYTRNIVGLFYISI